MAGRAAEDLCILVASARPEISGQVEVALVGISASPRVYPVTRPDLVLARAQILRPDLALIDLTVEATTGIALIRDLAAALPAIATIGLLPAGQFNTAREAVVAGARGVLAAPLQPDELAGTVRQVLTVPARPSFEIPAPALGQPVVFSGSRAGAAGAAMAINWSSSTLSFGQVRLALVVLASLGVGLAVIVSTYYVENVKLLVGLVGGIAFVLLTMRWPEFGILCFLALMSGLISLGSLPLLRLGPASLNISDIILFLLISLVFLRATTQPGFTLFGSPLLLPLLLFIGAFLVSAANSILAQGIGFNTVLRTVRVLSLWVVFVPTLQLVRNERALRRLLVGLYVLSGVLLLGVLFPNKFSPILALDEVAAGTGGERYGGLTRLYYAGDMVLYAMLAVTVASLAIARKGNQLWRLGFLGLLLYWLFRTFFREYWLTLAAACILLLAFLSREERIRLLKRVAPAAIVGAVVLVVLMTTQPARVEQMAYPLTHRLGSLLRNPLKREASLQWRLIETRYALVQIGLHPLLGIGLANSYRPPMESESDISSFSDWTYKYIENGYLYIGIYMGLAGLLPFLWLCTAYILRFVRHHREVQGERFREIYLGFGVAFLGMMACNVVSPTFVIGSRLAFFPVSMAICEMILRIEREKRVLQANC